MSHLPPDPSSEAAAPVSRQSKVLVIGTGEMPDRLRAHDWSTTALGTIESWSVSLVTSVNTVLGAPIPTALFWGSELRMIYNDAYRDLLGLKHPDALGERADVVWWDAWDAISPHIHMVTEGKGTVVQKDVLIPVSRRGRLVLRSRDSIDHETGRKGLVLTIADTGSGMSPHTIAKAFEPFFTTKGTTGTGLGLWISKKIVHRHSGKLSFKSSQREGHSGTVITLFLPSECHIREHDGGGV